MRLVDEPRLDLMMRQRDMPEIPTRREVLVKVLRKLASPRDLRAFLKFKFVTGDEYPYFDFADSFQTAAALLGMLGKTRLDIDAPVFIAGLRRSGTTVFYRIMNANSQLLLFNERFPGDRLGGRGVASSRNIYSIDEPDKFYRTAVRYLSPQLRARYNRWGAKLALELAHPDPGSVSVSGMRRIMAAFPAARVIGITRDPRDFVLSALKRGGHDVQWWIDEYREMMDLYGELGEKKRGSFMTIRYEDLVQSSADTLKKCCQFADLPYDKHMLDPSQWSIKGPREYASSGIVANIEKWRKGGDPTIVERVAKECFPAAQVFGYVPE